MKKLINLGALVVLALGVSNVFAQDTTTAPAPTPTPTTTTTSPTSSNMPAMEDNKDSKMKKNPDSKFMMMLATGGMNEITLSQTAVSKSTNEEVKSYAQKMIDDHTAVGEELKTLASSKMVTLPMEPDAKHKAMNDKLSTMSGAEFDMMYIKAMVKDHEKTVALLTKESNSGKDAEAKALAAKTLPTVQMHLDMAKTMMTSMSGGTKKADTTMKQGM